MRSMLALLFARELSVGVSRDMLSHEAENRPERQGSTKALSKTCVVSTAPPPTQPPLPSCASTIHLHSSIFVHLCIKVVSSTITTYVWSLSLVQLGVSAARPFSSPTVPSSAHLRELIVACIARAQPPFALLAACASNLRRCLHHTSLLPRACMKPSPPSSVPSASAHLETYELGTPV